MNLRVAETSSWPAIERAAQAVGACIKPGGVNNERAKESFEAGEGVRYFLQESRNAQYQWTTVGYIRLHRVSENPGNQLWIVDYASPFWYRSIRLAHQQLLTLEKRVKRDQPERC